MSIFQGVPSRELTYHISPWEKENHRLKGTPKEGGMVSFREGIYQVSWKFDHHGPFFRKIEAKGPQVLGPRQPISSCGNATQVGDVAGHVHRPGPRNLFEPSGIHLCENDGERCQMRQPIMKITTRELRYIIFPLRLKHIDQRKIDQYQNLHQNLSLFHSMKRQNFKPSLDSTRMETISKSWIRLAIGLMSHEETERIPDPNSLVPLHFPRGLPTDTELNSVE